MIDNITMSDTHPDTVRDILKVWKSMIEDCARDQSVLNNTVFIALMHFYRITDFLMEIEGETQTDIEQFIDFINDYEYSENIEWECLQIYRSSFFHDDLIVNLFLL